MTNENFSLNEAIKINLIIWAALIMGMLFFSAISIFLVTSGVMNVNQIEQFATLIYIVPSLAIICVFAGFFVFKQKLEAIREKTDVITKIAEYRAALIIRWALLEGAAFFSIVSYLLTGNYILLGIAVVIIIIFILIMPSRVRLETDLELSWQDKNDLSI